MIFHENWHQYVVTHRLSQAAENWQVDSLNIEPQTFCGLMEIKEVVTE